MELQRMENSKTSSQMNSDEASKLQENYAKSRLVWQLAAMITSSTHGQTASLLRSYLTSYNWSDEEEARIRRIASELEGIRAQMIFVETLSLPLIDTYKRPSSSAPTSAPSQTPMEDGAVPTNKPE